jgi:hypothetical protein
MSLHTDEEFLAAVAAALGESITVVRRRGFHLAGQPYEPEGRYPNRQHAVVADGRDDDPVDLADYGVDWDSHDDSRLHRRPRRRLTTSRRRKAA